MKYLLAVVFLVTTYLHFLPHVFQAMPFTMDQGRDLIDVRDIWQGHNLRFIGPTTSLNGVFLGPFYYYLISIPYLLFSGDPKAILGWQIILYQLSAVYFWKALKKYNPTFANIGAILLLVSPIAFGANHYFWNANFMLPFSILFFTFLLKAVLDKPRPWQNFTLGLISGIALQIEAAFGVLFFPFSLLLLIWQRVGLPSYSRLVSGFLITLLPQLLFEIKNYFPMTKIFISELKGETSTLGEKLEFADKLADRLTAFQVAFRNVSHVPYQQLIWTFITLIAAFLLFKIIKSKKSLPLQPALFVLVSFFVFASTFYFLYMSPIKSWYVYGISSLLIIFLSCLLSALITYSSKLRFLVLAFVFYSIYHFYLSQSEYLSIIRSKKADDPSGFVSQLQVIDDIYSQANGAAFKVYTYVPSVYDYAFQYLFWWHGARKYGYSPNDLAYLPHQPEYIKNKNSYLENTKEFTSDSPIFLIVQKGDNKRHLQEWEGNFAYLCEEKKTEYIFSLNMLHLKPCPAK